MTVSLNVVLPTIVIIFSLGLLIGWFMGRISGIKWTTLKLTPPPRSTTGHVPFDIYAPPRPPKPLSFGGVNDVSGYDRAHEELDRIASRRF